ncbi:MAG: hypothetical protein KAI03_06185, partial [Candidatus Aureabacteria bacterium]|nr:hypothetical protein [Candidatus Auribacterota bacterium]
IITVELPCPTSRKWISSSPLDLKDEIFLTDTELFSAPEENAKIHMAAQTAERKTIIFDSDFIQPLYISVS